ncbi:MAG: DNA primase [Candidatus Dormibacteraeota bacterium]|nr:DNA primase [Candidatus Dormibacteraeota bacterium]
MAPGDAVRDIKDRLDVVDVIGGYVRLQRAGRDYKGLCPFHSEKSPSFTVSTEKQVWYCFGCNEGGDMLSFVQKAEAVEFPQALQMLAEKAGVELEEHRGGGGRQRSQERNRAKEVNALAAQYFHHILLNHRAGSRGLRYLEKRAVAAETIAAFQVGFAPAGSKSDNLLRFLAKHKVSDDEAVKAGVALPPRGAGGAIDRFRGRLMFPIRDEQGAVIGFGGRSMDNTPPKYMNSPQTAIYDKGRVIYGLDAAKKKISAEGRALLVEGYFDVLMCHQFGHDHAIASSGTAVTADQLKAVRRFATELYLCLDTDEAGKNATQRVIADAARSGMRVMVVELPNAKDPGDFFLRSPDAWQMAEDAATAGWEWWLKGILERYKLSSPDGRDTAARAVIPVLSRIPEEATLDIYCQYAAQSLRVDPARLLADVQHYRKTGRAARPEPEAPAVVSISIPAGAEIPGRPEEDRLLGLMLSHATTGSLLAEITADEPLERPELEELCRRVSELVESAGPDALERNLERFSEEERPRLVRLSLVSRFTGAEAELRNALADCVNRIRLRNYEAAMAALEDRLKASGVGEDSGARDVLLNEHRQLAKRRASLRVQLFRGPT